MPTSRGAGKEQSAVTKPPFSMPSFDETPFLVLWELTRACDLACQHCRAEACTERDESELSLEEGFEALRQIKDMGTQLVVLTGGDPLKNPHAFAYIEEGARLGLRMTMTPSATPLLTRDAVARMASAGLQRMAVSLDGPDAVSHDRFRGVLGSFNCTWNAISAAHENKLPVQINSSICRSNVHQFDQMADCVAAAGATLWSVFFVVPVGRAGFDDELSAEEFEEVFAKMAKLAGSASFDIKSTAAPHFRRHLLQQKAKSDKRIVGLPGGMWRAARGVNDASGLFFLSHTGDVYPSGFLPISAGNIRHQTLAEIYRESELLRTLRNTDLLEGKCGCCEFKKVCGGSRARAYAFTGNYMAEEPCCSYQPRERAVREPLAEQKAV